jgi:iron complex outermembrane receptor protein
VAEVDGLGRLSLAELANVEVTSVSKSPEPLARAPASIYVITHEEIARSGAATLFEVLRLAPNLLVSQLGASNYVASARDFGGNTGAQNFANKLLILIDGRSVYSPLFSGIYADAQDLNLEDVDRIEVISGPGATLWGANAMNGVINIVTRPTYLTDGSFVRSGAGNQQQVLSARYGGKIDESRSYRFYAKGYHGDAMELPDGTSAHDGWARIQGGFRTDWAAERQNTTIQGDAYRATENQLGAGDVLISGANVLARWQRHTDYSDLSLQAYVDQTERFSPLNSGAFVLQTYDIQLQQAISGSARHQFVWGAGGRINSYSITNSPTLLFLPPHRSLTLANVFAQDTVSLGESVKLTLGLKMEDDPYSGWTPLPDARISWNATDKSDFWAAASGAVRSPTPFDQDVAEKLGTVLFLQGQPLFRPERVAAYEAGYRVQPADRFSLSVSGFYNVYDDLRTIEPASGTAFLPLHWGNLMKGDTFGVEAWAKWQVMDWWRLSPGVTWLDKRLRFKNGASMLLGLPQAGDDPKAHVSLNSSMNVGAKVDFDLSLRYVSPLPNPELASYYDMSARIAWRASKALELSVNGENLLHARHQEYAGPAGEEIVRSVMAEAQWKF